MAHGIWRDFLTAAWQAFQRPSPQEVAEVGSEQARGVERLAEDVILRNADQRRRVRESR